MIETNKIYNEDCLEGMKRIDDESIDFICCDLPYGTTDCRWDSVIPSGPLFEQYRRILKPNGTICLFGSEPFSTSLRMSAMDLYKYDWVWKKTRPTGFQHAKNMPLKDYELISVFSKGSMGHKSLLGDRRMTYNPQGLRSTHVEVTGALRKAGGVIGTRPSHKDSYVREQTGYPHMVLEFPSIKNDLHPTQKPVDLVEYLVKTYTDPGDLVLDNCMGSGTTAEACINSGRSYIGFEMNEDYYQVCLGRIAKALGRLADDLM